MIKIETHGKFLGIEIDNKLKFHNHIKNLCNKLSKTTGILYRLKNVVPTFVLINLYYSLVYPYLCYCNIVWGGTYNSALDQVFKLQKRIIRIINNADYLAHTRPLFKSSNILNIYDLNKYTLGNYMYKVKNKMIDDVNIKQHNHSINTRYRDNYCPQFQRLTITQKSYVFSAPSVWNDLPHEVQNSTTYSIFKKHNKQHYINSIDVA